MPCGWFLPLPSPLCVCPPPPSPALTSTGGGILTWNLDYCFKLLARCLAAKNAAFKAPRRLVNRWPVPTTTTPRRFEARSTLIQVSLALIKYGRRRIGKNGPLLIWGTPFDSPRRKLKLDIVVCCWSRQAFSIDVLL